MGRVDKSKLTAEFQAFDKSDADCSGRLGELFVSDTGVLIGAVFKHF